MKHSLADQSTLAGHAGVEGKSLRNLELLAVIKRRTAIVQETSSLDESSVAEGSRWTKSICENIQPSQLHLHYSKLSD
ncbi:hypothetical protein RRG08_044082 [Elysia crispata]|uniref:Uncharacterized protein n=1 Tax=Elysia crispata TaxID=231223 RepID=A0AAE1AXV1_9GAST|nr:hypothetical protein RRG08_044082 [Elysia crispata]